MSAAERQLVRDGYAAFARGDMDWIRRTLHPDFELHTIFLGTGTRGRGSGVRLQQRFAILWSFRDGRPVRGVSYSSVDEGMRAAGLEP